eukprot:6408795-Amphidinium_carterae.1
MLGKNRQRIAPKSTMSKRQCNTVISFSMPAKMLSQVQVLVEERNVPVVLVTVTGMVLLGVVGGDAVAP